MTSQNPLSAQVQRLSVSAEIPLTYLHFNPGKNKPLLILLHGFEDTAAGFFKRALSEGDSKYEILAPNGLFPMPVRIPGGGWKQTFAWYFADFSKRQVLIPPTVASQAVLQLVHHLNLQDRPKVLLGFSQGGFFLPFVLPHLHHVKKAFAIGSAYRPEDYPEHFNIPVDALHGKEDQIVSYERARESFESFKHKNPHGRFYSFEGLGHTMNAEARILLKQKIDEVFHDS